MERMMLNAVKSVADAAIFAASMGNLPGGDVYDVENVNGNYRVDATSLLGMMYAVSTFGDGMYLVNRSHDGVFPEKIRTMFGT